jgi:hypothetical protein
VAAPPVSTIFVPSANGAEWNILGSIKALLLMMSREIA